MLDIKLIRENPSAVESNLKRRQDPEKLKLLKDLIKYDKEYREALQRLEALKHKKNIVTKEIAKSKDSRQINEMKSVSKEITTLTKKQADLKKKVDSALMNIPNMLHESVPYGKNDDENVEIRRFGEAPKFDFKPKNHLEILEGLDLVDSERAAKVAGHGFFYFKNDLVLLDFALMKFTIDFMLKRGYKLINPPYMLQRKPYEGVVSLGDFENVMYKIEKEDLYLIATSEHPLVSMFMDEVLDKKDLPIKLVGVSPCFRREVGAHGKYTKGLFRMHQFNKIEQVIFCLPEQSWDLHEELQKNSEDLYKELEIPFRVLNVCTGDIGDLAAKKYDTDVWMADGKFREAGSNSNMTDYQARRLNVRFREKEGLAPAGVAHSLNNTAIATSRTMLAILEVHQQADGSVKIPKALQPYMGKTEIKKQ